MSYPPVPPGGSAEVDQPVNLKPDTKKAEKKLVEHKDFKDRLMDGQDAHGKSFKEGQIDYEFWSLKQWEAESIKSLAEEGRPALTFDRTRPIVQAVLGSQITQRFQALCLPRDTSLMQPDLKLAESGTKVFKYCQGRGNYEQIETLAFQDTLVTGVGAIEMFSSFDENPDGDIKIARVPHGSLLWDPASTEPGCLDARWIIRGRWMDRKRAENLYGMDKLAGMTGTTDETTTRVKESIPTWNLFAESDTQGYDQTRDQILLYHYQCFDTHYQTRIVAPDVENPEILMQSLQDPNGILPRIDALKDKGDAMEFYLDLQAKIEAMNMQLSGNTAGPIPYPNRIEDFPVKVFYDSVHTRTECLRSRVLKHPSFTYMIITAFEDWSKAGRRGFFGIVRPMRDPQRYANKFLSQAVHLFTANPKGALMAESDMFEDPAKAMVEYAKATGFMEVRPGALSQSTRPKFAQLSSNVSLRGIETLLSYAMQAVSASVGISEASFLGQAGDVRRVSGEALNSLLSQQQKTQVLPFDSLRLYRKTMGRLLLSFVQNDMDEQQLRRILSSPDDQFFLQMHKDEALLDEYDIIIEESPASPNEKQQIFQVLMDSQILNQFMSQGIPIPPSLAEFFPLPSLSTQELKTTLELVYKVQMATMEMQLQQLIMQGQQMQQQQQALAAGQAPMPAEGAPPEGAPPPEGGPPQGQPPPPGGELPVQ